MCLAILIVFMSSIQASAEYKFGFASTSLNRLDWNRQTEDKSTKRDFSYLEIEGGAQFSWGEVYGFFDYENIGKAGTDVRTAAKGSLNYYLLETPLSIYLHVYDFNADGFAEQNRVVGLGYSFDGNGWFFKPFLGFHDVSQTFFSGPNGYMAGWVVAYNFKISSQLFMIADWHEFEFDRANEYAAGQGGKRYGHNGALSLWWNAPHNLSPGLQWRYATDKLGTPGTLGALITTLKYNL